MDALEMLYRALADELWNRGDLTAVDRYFDEGYLGHDSLYPRKGRQSMKDAVIRFREAIGDLRYAVEDVFCSGDRVAARWVVTGRHTGTLFGIAPTGRRLRIAGMSINRIERGKVMEGWVFNDVLSLLQQLDQPLAAFE